MALKIFKGKTEPQCGCCEFAEITAGTDVAVCRKMGAVMQLHSKCKKFKYDPLKRQPKAPVFKNDFTKEDFEI